jgi:hypothetical protein
VVGGMPAQAEANLNMPSLYSQIWCGSAKVEREVLSEYLFPVKQVL